MENNRGPFHGFGVEFQCRARPWRGGLVTSDVDALVLRTVAACKALARSQLVSLIGPSAKASVTRLVRGGFLDEYQSGKTPPVYALGRGGAEIMEVAYRRWNTVDLLRTVAGNQLWVRMRALWSDAAWEGGPAAVLTRMVGARGVCFRVVAPRLRPAEPLHAVQAANALRRGERLIVVAAAEMVAAEVASLAGVRDDVRYTWDSLLRQEPRFYAFQDVFVPDEGFRFGPEKFFREGSQPPLTEVRGLSWRGAGATG